MRLDVTVDVIDEQEDVAFINITEVFGGRGGGRSHHRTQHRR